MHFHPARLLPLLAATCLLVAGAAKAQSAEAGLPSGLTAAQIVDQIQRHNQERNQALKQYKALRHYQVEYHGFSANIVGKMDVELSFDAATGKSFRIVSQSGSKMLCEKVLKRAVDSEKEASQDKRQTALTPANYRFRLAGSETLDGRPSYILEVEPLVESKFLYRGKVWVDAADFAVVKLEVEPAKNPSFWITRTHIHSTHTHAGGFWLPAQNRSVTKVRIGGTAILTIDYGTYQTVPDQLRP
jgi:hypothetical protein